MALVTNNFWLTISLADNGANVSTKTYQLQAADFATATTDAATIIAALNGVTNSVIVGYSLSERFIENAISYPAAGVENEDKASITGLLVGGIKKANFQIPAPVISMFQGATGPAANIVDVSDAALVVYADLFDTGGEAYISDGELLDFMLSGSRISAKSRKG